MARRERFKCQTGAGLQASAGVTVAAGPEPTPAAIAEQQLCFSSATHTHAVRWMVHGDGGRRQRRSGQPPAAAGRWGCTFASLTAPAPTAPPQQQPQQLQVAATQASEQPALELLPVGTHRGRGFAAPVMRYVWDGQQVTAVDESTLCQLSTASGRLGHWITGLFDRLYRAFLPDPKDVTPDYWEWLRWRLTQRFFSSTIQNLSTQSLLLALGMGAKKTIAASAAINWLLKDGVGRITRMTVATNFGQAFDSDLKRIRFTTSIIFEATIAGEFITPFFPQHFLALASLANLGKAIALAAFVATAPAFQQALCMGGNLADLTAKNQAQHMMVDMLSLGVSASAMYAAKNMKVPALLPLVAYPFLACGDLYSIYRELKAVQLRTMNRERAEMVAAHWVRTRTAPSAAQVSATERLLLPPSEGGELLALHIVPLDQMLGRAPHRLPNLLKSYADTQYMLDVQQAAAHPDAARAGSWRWPWQASPRPRLVMSLSEHAHGPDILTGILESVYLRQAVQEAMEKRQRQAGQGQGGMAKHSSRAASGEAPAAQQPSASPRPQPAGTQGARDGSWAFELDEAHVSALAKAAHTRAKKDVPIFLRDIKAAGWKVSPFLLSTNEKEGYVVLDRNGHMRKS